MAIDAETRRPKLARVVGGLSGPGDQAGRAAHGVAGRQRGRRSRSIGMGGIMDGEDAVEFMLAGATAVAVGTANFVDPTATMRVLDGLGEYCREHGVGRVADLIGALEL